MKPVATPANAHTKPSFDEGYSSDSFDVLRLDGGHFVYADAGAFMSANAAAPAIATAAAGPAKYFSPYVDMSLWATDVTAISNASGVNNLTLAFMQTTVDTNGDVVLKNGLPSLSWGGLGTRMRETSATIIREVKALEAKGGTVTISIGGASGIDPAVYAAAHGLSAARLQAEYQSVINQYGVDHLDFDIENTATVDNFAANHLRDLAIAGLERKNPDLKISFTLAVTPKGLQTLPNGQATNAANDAAAAAAGIGNDIGVLKQAITDHVRIDTVNIMAMDYYDGNPKEAAPKGTGVNAMYTNAVTAARAAETQLTQLGIASVTKVGITPMIGQNDDVREVFTLVDAQRLEAFAASTNWVAGLGEWALTRDNASTTLQLGAADATYSGVVQSAYQFAHTFAAIETTAATAAAVQQASLAAPVR